jgi:YVTN family beta-propeller protein
MRLRGVLAAVLVVGLVVAGCSGEKGDASGGPSAASRPTPRPGEPIPIGKEIWSVAITPDSRFAYVANPEHLTVVDLESRKVVDTLSFFFEGGKQVRFSKDGKQAYLAGSYTSGSVRFIDTATRAVTGTVEVDGDSLTDLAVAPDGRHVYAAGAGIGVVRVDVSKKVIDQTVSLPDAERGGIIVSPDGGRVYVTNAPAYSGDGPAQNSLTVLDAATGKVAKTIQLPGSRPDDVVITPDGKRIFVSYETYDTEKPNFVSVLDAATLAIVAKVPVTGRSHGMAITPDGKQVFVTGMDEKPITDETPGMADLKPQIEIIDTTTDTVTTTIPGLFAKDIEITPNGHQAVVSTGNDLVPITLD